MNTEDIKNKLNCEHIDMKELSIKELKHLKNQAKSLTDKRMKRKCKSSNREWRRLLCSIERKSRKFLQRCAIIF